MVLTISVIATTLHSANAAQTNSCPTGQFSDKCNSEVRQCSGDSKCIASAYAIYNYNNDVAVCNSGDAAKKIACNAQAVTDFNAAKAVVDKMVGTTNAGTCDQMGNGCTDTSGLNNQAMQDKLDAVSKDINKKGDLSCSVTGWSVLNPVELIGGAFCVAVKYTLLNIATSFMVIAAKFLDLSVNWSIFGFADVFSKNSNALYTIWKGVRDIVNLFVSFGLFFAAGKYIIGQGEEIRKTVARLIIFALLTNFSLPITKAVVDFTNVVGLNTFSAYVTGYNTSRPNSATVSGQSYGLATKIAQMSGGSILITDSTKAETSIFAGLNGITGALVAVFITIALTVILAQSAILLASRAVVLFFCLVTSPLMFIHALVPKFMGFDISDLSERWRSTFFKAALMAPVMFVMYGLAFNLFKIIGQAFQVVGVDTVLADGNTWSAMVKPITTSILMIGLLGYSNKVSANLCGALGEKAAALTGRATNAITGAVIGSPSSWALRKAAGYSAARIKNSKWVQDRTGDGEKGNRFTRNLGNTLVKSSDRVLNSKSNLDFVRGTMNATNKLQSAVGLNTYSYGNNRRELGNDAKKYDAKFKTAKALEVASEARKERTFARNLEESNKAEDKNRTESINARRKYSEDLKTTADSDAHRIANIAMINDLRVVRDQKLAKLDEESSKKLAALDIQINKMKEDVRKGLPGREPHIRAVEAEKKRIEDEANKERQKITSEAKDETSKILADSRAERAKQKATGIDRLKELPDLPKLKDGASEEEKRIYEAEKAKVLAERQRLAEEKTLAQAGMTSGEKAADDIVRNQTRYKESLAQSQERIAEETLAQTQARLTQAEEEKAANLKAGYATEKFYTAKGVANTARTESEALNRAVSNNVREEVSKVISEIGSAAAQVGAGAVKTLGDVANPLQESKKPKDNMEFMDTMKKVMDQISKKSGSTA